MIEPPLDYFRSELAKGMSQGEVIAAMKCRGLSILDAIKAAREVFAISLGEAKQLVASHPDYCETAAASAPLQDELIQSFQDVAEQRNVEK
jgi:ribosomal protein L7/L12